MKIKLGTKEYSLIEVVDAIVGAVSIAVGLLLAVVMMAM